MSRLVRAGDVLLVLAVLLACWQLLFMAAGDTALAAPLTTLSYVFELLGSPRFWPHIAETMRAFVYALVWSILLGLGLGVWLGGHRLSGEVAEPILVALYSLPKITLYPLILLVFGLGMSAKVAFGVIHGFIPITIFTMNALLNIRPVLLKVGKTMNLTERQTIFTIMLPATLPEVSSGLRVGFSLTLLGVIIGEMFASKRGLGHLIVHAVEFADTRTMLAVTIILFAFASLSNALLLFLDKVMHRQR
jgi:NitT/TauT family transport system permease protein